MLGIVKKCSCLLSGSFGPIIIILVTVDLPTTVHEAVDLIPRTKGLLIKEGLYPVSQIVS